MEAALSNLVRWLAGTIRDHVAERRSNAAFRDESRTIFHGPPLDILALVYEELAGGGGNGAKDAHIL